MNFSEKANDCRKKFNFCLESILKGHSDMHVIKFKNKWDFYDKALVCMDKFTECGLYSYWEAVDSAFSFNVKCHESFLAKSKFSKNQGNNGSGCSETSKEEKQVHQRLGHKIVTQEDRHNRHRPLQSTYALMCVPVLAIFHVSSRNTTGDLDNIITNLQLHFTTDSSYQDQIVTKCFVS